jgi:hypothetical protein
MMERAKPETAAIHHNGMLPTVHEPQVSAAEGGSAEITCPAVAEDTQLPEDSPRPSIEAVAERPREMTPVRTRAIRPIKDRINEEIAAQEAMGFVLPPRLLPDGPYPLDTSIDVHDKFYFPRVEDEFLAHSFIFGSPEELAEFYRAAEEISGGKFSDTDKSVAHENKHAEAMLHLGQKSVRFVARLQAHPTIQHKGREVRPLSVTPSALMEDVTTTLLGNALMLTAPDDRSDEDLARLDALGLTYAQAIQLGKEYNEQHGTHYYPVP